MKVYEAVYSEGLTDGVLGISLVDDPAMEDLWIALSEQPQKIQFEAIDEERQLLLGAVLIPNKKIYRNIDGNEFYITFSEETIGKLAHNFIKNGNQNNSTIEHEQKINSVSFVESWQVEDPKVDKSALYGKEFDKGTWVTMAHVSDKALFEEAKNGNLKGFSIDAMLQLEEINFNNNSKIDFMTRSDFLEAFRSLFTADEVVEEVKAEEIEVKSEEVTEEVPTTEEPQTTAEVDTPEVEEEDLSAVISEMKTHLDKKDELATKLSKEIEEKDAKIKELEAELAKEPEVDPITPTGEEDRKPMTFKDNKPASVKSRVFENLANNLWN